MKSGGFTQLGERSAAGAVAGDSADDNDAVATSDLVVRHKDPVIGSVDFFDIWRIHDRGTWMMFSKTSGRTRP